MAAAHALAPSEWGAWRHGTLLSLSLASELDDAIGRMPWHPNPRCVETFMHHNGGELNDGT